MNLKDDEWEPDPTDPIQLRKLRILAKSAVNPHDIAKLRSVLLAAPFNGAVPHEIRGTVWLLLLRLRSEDLLAEDPATFAKSARDAVADENSREQIDKDVQRTRPGLSRFKQPAVRGALLRLLSLFCERRQVAYVQGFNELLAPFVLLADTGGNPRIVYALFAEFVTRFAPWMLETSESRVFDVLKRLFKYFGRLLLYHDPELYWLLERHMMTPDLYATSWFVTLFARNFTVESIMALWDLLLLEDDPLGTSFFGIALLRSKRDELLSVDESRIPETLMMLTANSPGDVRKLWKIGSEMRMKHTPPSFQRLMTDRILNANSKSTPVALSAARAMQASVCLQTTPDDLVSAGAHYFTWDCRTEAEFHAGHLAQAAHLPLDALREANGKITSETSEAARQELQHAVDLCEPLKNSSHICLIGSGVKEEDNMDINMLALYLTRIGIPYVSTLRGGFVEVLRAGNESNSLSAIELVDYDRRRHQEARRERIAAQKARERQAQLKERNAARVKRFSASPLSQGTSAHQESPSPSNPPPFSSILAGSNVFSSFTDAEVGKAFRKALNGIGLSSANSNSNDEKSTSEEQTVGSNYSPKAAAQQSSNTLMSLTSSIRTNETDLPSRKQSNGIPKLSMASVDSNEITPRPLNSNGSGSSTSGNLLRKGSNRSRFGSQDKPTEPKSYTATRTRFNTGSNSASNDTPTSTSLGASFFTSLKSPWGRDAKPGWLDDHTLTYPLSSLPKNFNVNVMDEKVMNGLRLFPCKARSERILSSPCRPGEFKKRYIGVSRYYIILFGPHYNRSHLLEVKLMRYLHDITRITFKRNRPEVVTFEITSGTDADPSVESIVCLMPDGLTECVALIKKYSDEEAGSEDVPSDREDTPDSTPECCDRILHSSSSEESQTGSKAEGRTREWNTPSNTVTTQRPLSDPGKSYSSATDDAWGDNVFDRRRAGSNAVTSLASDSAQMDEEEDAEFGEFQAIPAAKCSSS
ncbi:Rhodanese-like protein [Gracilaria domingensis]|nr:Rhodanese-like protein [Gracilaria domingensis]